MDDDSELSSSLSEHSEKEIQRLAPIFLKAKKATKLVAPPPPVSPPRPKRPPSPPHEEVLADNPDVAFIVMFRSRFGEAMSSKLPHFGPQDIERGVVDVLPSPQVQQLMCALLGLALNRKKPVERGHHGRALEEAVSSHRSQWPMKWNGQNPLHGGKNFENMSPSERLNLLRTLVMWALSSSEAIQTIIKEKYKQNRHNDDENQPLSVQPWGIDGDRRRYYLIQGQDDTGFRVYRDGNRYNKNAHWWSQAGDIEEIKTLAKKLEEEDHAQPARRLAAKMLNAIPTFEATEDKRKRREYRQSRRAAFARPEPGFSLYEGRTRGKRMRYTFDDDDDDFISDDTNRRSTRQSGRNTPLDNGPTYTASGRQVRAPKTGDYGESLLSGAVTSADEHHFQQEETTYAEHSGTEDSEPIRSGRPARSRGRVPNEANGSTRGRKHIEGYNEVDEMSNEDEADDSGDDWHSDDADDEDMADADDGEDGMSDFDEDDEVDMQEPQSLVVKLKVPANGRVRPAINGDTMASDKTEHGQGLTINTLSNGTTKAEPKTDIVMDSANTNIPPPHTKIVTPVEHVESTDQPISSPLAPSAYPTPASTSFVSSEHKPIFGATPVAPNHADAQVEGQQAAACATLSQKDIMPTAAQHTHLP